MAKKKIHEFCHFGAFIEEVTWSAKLGAIPMNSVSNAGESFDFCKGVVSLRDGCTYNLSIRNYPGEIAVFRSQNVLDPNCDRVGLSRTIICHVPKALINERRSLSLLATMNSRTWSDPDHIRRMKNNNINTLCSSIELKATFIF